MCSSIPPDLKDALLKGQVLHSDPRATRQHLDSILSRICELGNALFVDFDAIDELWDQPSSRSHSLLAAKKEVDGVTNELVSALASIAQRDQSKVADKFNDNV